MGNIEIPVVVLIVCWRFLGKMLSSARMSDVVWETPVGITTAKKGS
jgi:hypothetical protein